MRHKLYQHKSNRACLRHFVKVCDYFMKKIKLTILLVFFSILVKAQAISSVKLSVVLYGSYDDVQTVYETLESANLIVESIDNGKSPEINFKTDWNQLANRFKEIAKNVESAPLVTDFDNSRYTISISDINNCYLKKQNIVKLETYNEEISRAIRRGQDEIAFISKYKNSLIRIEVILDNLAKAAVRFSNLPVYSLIFPLHWYDVEVVVKPALGDLNSAIKKHESKLSRQISKMTIENDNLAQNVTLLNNNICKLEGSYYSNYNQTASLTQMKIVIEKRNDSYTAAMHELSRGVWKTVNIKDVMIDNKYISFSLTRDFWSQVGYKEIRKYSGTFSSDYKSIIDFSTRITYIQRNQDNTTQTRESLYTDPSVLSK